MSPYIPSNTNMIFFTILFSFSVPISLHRLIFNRVIGFSGGTDPSLWILNIVVVFFIENMPLIKYLLGWLLETWKELYKGKIWKLKSYHHFGYLLLPISCNLFLFFSKLHWPLYRFLTLCCNLYFPSSSKTIWHFKI